jgi:hypothetical protein
LSANAVVPASEKMIPMLVSDVLRSMSLVFRGTAVAHNTGEMAHNRMSVAGPLLLMT